MVKRKMTGPFLCAPPLKRHSYLQLALSLRGML